MLDRRRSLVPLPMKFTRLIATKERRLMLKLSKPGLTLAAALMVSTAMPAQAQQVAAPTRTINLPVELKDPYTAYSVGLVPFYSHAAASYVGTSRLSWQPSEKLSNAANTQILGDIGFLAAGVLLAGAGVVGNSPGLSIASLVSFIAVPISHVAFYAPFWGQEAVRFNIKQMTDSGFASQAKAPAVQKADQETGKDGPKIQFADPAEYRPTKLKLGQ